MVQIVDCCTTCGSWDVEWRQEKGTLPYLHCRQCYNENARHGASTWIFLTCAAVVAIAGWWWIAG